MSISLLSEPMRSLQDGYGRNFNGLRISVTQKCNLKCPHCHREGQMAAAVEMRPEEIERIVSVAASLGAKKVKITGGEPLLREDIADIVRRIRSLVQEVSLTTNGILLIDYARDLKNAGLDRINVSLHSLTSNCLEKIAGRDYLDDVKAGILTAKTVGLSPIKINMVILKGINDAEIGSMMEFASDIDGTLQLIELASDRSGCNDEFFQRHYFPLRELEESLKMKASNVTFNDLHRRAQYTVVREDKPVRVEIVRSMHNSSFCAHCTRLRLTSDGKIKGCLYQNGESADLLSALRSGAGNEELATFFIDAMKHRKPYWN
jgi:cyclic pyranopterin phosphate synthase